MQTKRSTLSSLLMIPAFVSPSQMSTPSIGEMTILAMAKALIAPTGIAFHEGTFMGTLSRASADPRHISPMGTLAAPTKVAVSIMKASGG